MEVRNLNLKEEYFKDMDYDSINDPLTDMISRKHMLDYMEYLIHNKVPFSFINIDVDKFRLFNNVNGHKMGDLLMIELTKIIIKSLGDNSVIARFGGDELAIVVKGDLTYDEKWALLRNIHQNIRKPVQIENDFFNITITSGIAEYPENSRTLNDVLICADKAIYRGKEKGGNCYIIYNETRHKNINPNFYTSLPSKMMRLKSIFMESNDINYKLEEALMESCEQNGLDGIGYYKYDSMPLVLSGRLKIDMESIPSYVIEDYYKDGIIKVNSRGELKEECELYKYFFNNGIRAGLIVSIKKRDVYGFLLMYSNHNKEWTENNIALALYLADLISNTI